MNKYNTTSFWLDNAYDYDVLTGEKLEAGKDYHKIASTLRAISNFVNIVTGQSIPVTYSSKDDSYTDGKTVVLSSNIKDKDFNPTVGLALHEGSHIKLTDFTTLTRLFNDSVNTIPKHLIKLIAEKYYATVKAKEEYAISHIQSKVKDLLNYVEDRRIDNFIYTTAPGYRGYYQAMYDKYFHSPIIDRGLNSNDYRTEDWESYFFRILNLTNPNRDLKALNGLLDIWKEIDLRKISRLNNTKDALTVAFNIFEIIEENIEADSLKNKKDTDGEDADGEDTNSKPPSALTDSQIEKLKKAIQKQKDFQNGNIKKTNMSMKDKLKVEALKESGSEMKNVGIGIREGKGTNCLIVKNITKRLCESGLYETLKPISHYGTQESTITKGLVLGTQLGKKLQIRNDERTLKFNRLSKGNIDKRMIASLGFGNEQVFQQTLVERFTPVHLHISIDASGSMYGDKWRQSQISAIAIAKAASMVQNLEVVISYRSSEHIGRKMVPAIFIAYDSKKDKISKIRKLFGYIGCPGVTPEGLCFEAIQKEIIDGSSTLDSYFLNFSDGAPWFCNADIQYSGQIAIKHTKKQIDNMRSRGIHILSYYIGSGNTWAGDMVNFKAMYGRDAEEIDTNKLITLARSLNKKFATQGENI